MTTRWTRLPLTLLAGLLLGALSPRVGHGEPESPEPDAPATIAWVPSLTAAFERAVAEKKVVMICINARSAIGEREEPAAKGLREIVYRDPAVVEKSRSFVCVLLTAEGSSEDYGELRYRFGIDGNIVSPQHIFARPDHPRGESPLVRREHWPYGSGARAVEALVALMDEALEAYQKLQSVPAAPSVPGSAGEEDSTVPASGAERTAWIEKLLDLIRGRDADLRRRALRALSTHDREGDCLGSLIPLLEELDEPGRASALTDVVRTLGVPGFEAAAPALHRLLGHVDIHVRANTAVTLEYIGSATSTDCLLACVKREKDAGVANHMYRAIGRCGAADSGAQRALLRGARPGKEDDFPSFGPVIGLSYAAGDAKLARALEREVLKLSPPSQRGKNGHTFLRVLLVWCLGEIRDPGTATFLRKRVLEPPGEEAAGADDFVKCCEAVARKCEGDADAGKDVDAAVSACRWADNARALADRARRGRDMHAFVPKGEWGNLPKHEEEDEAADENKSE